MKKNRSIYWAAITTDGMFAIINSSLTGLQIRLFFVLVSEFMNKENNSFGYSNTDVLKKLNLDEDFTLSKPALYSALRALEDQQFIVPLESTKGFMINPFIVYFGKNRDLTNKLLEFEKLAHLQYTGDIDQIYDNAKFDVSHQIAEIVQCSREDN